MAQSSASSAIFHSLMYVDSVYGGGLLSLSTNIFVGFLRIFVQNKGV